MLPNPAQGKFSGLTIIITFPDQLNENSRRYQLEVIQHPERTAEIGNGAVLSRLPLSPPLVVKITVEDAEGNTIPA